MQVYLIAYVTGVIEDSIHVHAAPCCMTMPCVLWHCVVTSFSGLCSKSAAQTMCIAASSHLCAWAYAFLLSFVCLQCIQ